MAKKSKLQSECGPLGTDGDLTFLGYLACISCKTFELCYIQIFSSRCRKFLLYIAN